jgi:L-glyceraldehyde 3-phosphate reductase
MKLLQQVAIEPAEENFGRLLRDDFASLDQSLKRMGLKYVDIFYSHRVDEKTPRRWLRRYRAARRCISASRRIPLSALSKWWACCASGKSRC